MSFGRRRPFRDLIERQLAFFEEEHGGLLRDVRNAERAYDDAEREGAEERYGDYVDLVDTGTELLAGIRDSYAATLDEGAAAQYEDAFNRAAARRFPRLGLELGER
ncbi:MAG TPA: hypothetical protein VK874_06635 [Gaiellaceae bacterium]|nr:hypothetical protein [Gaiellaceae bacterium]